MIIPYGASWVTESESGVICICPHKDIPDQKPTVQLCLTEMTTSASKSIHILHQKPYSMHKCAKEDKIAMLYSFDSLYVVDSK